ncbi:hypothetical protein LINPERHAP1_LOCUS17863 [Linum perenne]
MLGQCILIVRHVGPINGSLARMALQINGSLSRRVYRSTYYNFTCLLLCSALIPPAIRRSLISTPARSLAKPSSNTGASDVLGFSLVYVRDSLEAKERIRS